ncbi:MAG TPA: NFACT family protein [Fimbriimonas sp.]|nr:NFACT family protein [Fimbriimonas sp.]
MRIPFDSVVLASVLDEIRPFVGGLVQDVRQPDATTIALGLYHQGREGVLLLSCHPNYARVHFVTRRVPNAPEPPVFCATLRARIQDGRLEDASQIASDRILTLTFLSDRGEHLLVAELMGKHSNLILLENGHRIVAAAKWVGPDKSSRPIQPNGEYLWPPVIDSDLLEQASPDDPEGWFAFAAAHPSRVSPFFRSVVESLSAAPAAWSAHWSPGKGAYPLPLPDPTALPRSSISLPLEQQYAEWVVQDALTSQKSSLLGQLERVLLARETAVSDLRQVSDSAQNVPKWQRYGELILAYGHALQAGSSLLEATDYDGSAARIKLDPELDFKENASKYFECAKRSKGRIGLVHDQISRLEEDWTQVAGMIERVEKAEKLSELLELTEEARHRRWLFSQPTGSGKDERPYEGHRIRELMGPGGIRVLYGETAESNDYLTLRVAKPNDIWLHVRGSTSAHVVIPTQNHPEKIGKEHLMFAAKVAVQNSKSKHSGYVPVDYTLRRYVRRPKGAAKGAALYTHEKTLHVEGE